MAVRRQRATTKSEVVDNDIKKVINDGKSRYRHGTDEFFIFETRKGSGYYFADSSELNGDYEQHWKFNFNSKRWEMQ